MSDILCVRCDKKLENFMEGRGFQPNYGLAFITYGHYGSTFFDPMDGSWMEIAIGRAHV